MIWPCLCRAVSIYTLYIWTCIHVNESCRKKKERSKQGHMALSVHSCKYMDVYMYIYVHVNKYAEGASKAIQIIPNLQPTLECFGERGMLCLSSLAARGRWHRELIYWPGGPVRCRYCWWPCLSGFAALSFADTVDR